jgi:hypothetical protein
VYIKAVPLRGTAGAPAAGLYVENAKNARPARGADVAETPQIGQPHTGWCRDAIQGKLGAYRRACG